MSEPTDEPTLDDVITPTEQAVPDPRAHAKTPAHLNDEALQRRTEHERIEVGIDDYDPNAVPDAEA